MARVTSKLQVTIPKAIAQRYEIRPGSDIDWLPAGDAIRVVPNAGHQGGPDRGRRLQVFDAATKRLGSLTLVDVIEPDISGRGWRREDLYERGLAD